MLSRITGFQPTCTGTSTSTSFHIGLNPGSTWASAVFPGLAAAAPAVVGHRITVDQERAAGSVPR